jgi:hypothetical protein
MKGRQVIEDIDFHSGPYKMHFLGHLKPLTVVCNQFISHMMVKIFEGKL